MNLINPSCFKDAKPYARSISTGRAFALNIIAVLVSGLLVFTTASQAQRGHEKDKEWSARYVARSIYLESKRRRPASTKRNGKAKANSSANDFSRFFNKLGEKNRQPSGTRFIQPRGRRRQAMVRKEHKAPETPLLGKLVVNTGAPDANVLIKNQGAIVQQGRSENGSFSVNLSPGEYEVEVTSAKLTLFNGKAIVKANAIETVSAKLPRTGSIIINLSSAEPDLLILIDGQVPANLSKTEEGEVKLENIPIGSHTLRFTHRTIKDLEQPVEVFSGAPLYINPVFDRVYGQLIVKSEPGAYIYIDGKLECKVTESGQTEIIHISPGPHNIRAEKEGYTPTEINKDFGTDQIEVELRLTRSGS